MKFAMNGALTIGTLDGANVEIRDAVGAENFFLFGLTADEVERAKAHGYRPRDIYESNAGAARGARPDRQRALLARRPRAVPAARRFAARPRRLHAAGRLPGLRRLPAARRARVSRRPTPWTRMSILNGARIGRFSSDRSIREYCRDIWHVAGRVADAMSARRGATAASAGDRHPGTRAGDDGAGASAPLGATVRPGGVNFSVFSKNATSSSCCCSTTRTAQPARASRSIRESHRTYHYWHAFVPGARAGPGLRLPRPRPVRAGRGLRFDREKVLLDPYGLAVAVPDDLRPRRRHAGPATTSHVR